MPNKILQALAAPITWLSTGGINLLTATSLGAAAGRQGAYHTLTAATRQSRRFGWRAWIVPGATRVVGEVIEVYLVTGDGTRRDNNDGTGDIAVTAKDKLRNAQFLGVIEIDGNAAVVMSAGGTVEIGALEVAPVLWNATANVLSATATDFGFSLTPIEDEVQ